MWHRGRRWWRRTGRWRKRGRAEVARELPSRRRSCVARVPPTGGVEPRVRLVSEENARFRWLKAASGRRAAREGWRRRAPPSYTPSYTSCSCEPAEGSSKPMSSPWGFSSFRRSRAALTPPFGGVETRERLVSEENARFRWLKAASGRRAAREGWRRRAPPSYTPSYTSCSCEPAEGSSKPMSSPWGFSSFRRSRAPSTPPFGGVEPDLLLQTEENPRPE